jgi:PadR family transcriptional regulator, regulatory protein PadR
MLGILLRMGLSSGNWRSQIRKGYLELCILLLIRERQRLYGFEILETLAGMDLEVKEGTLYPLLNRMTTEGVLASVWETENLKGHPRKFYSLTREGKKLLDEMNGEFERMVGIFQSIGRKAKGKE